MKKRNPPTFNPGLTADKACSSQQICGVSKAMDLAVVAVFLAQAAVYRDAPIGERGFEHLPDSNHSSVLKKMELLAFFEEKMLNGLGFADAIILTREKSFRLGVSIYDFAGAAL